MEATIITCNKFEDISNGLLKYGVAYNHEKTNDLSASFIATVTLINEMLKMYTGLSYTAIEAQARRNSVSSSLESLHQELKCYYNETPDELTKEALSDFDSYMNIFN